MSGNFVVKLASAMYGTVAFDIVPASSTSAAITAAEQDTGASWAQEAAVGFQPDPNVGELLSDNTPDPITNALPSNPGE